MNTPVKSLGKFGVKPCVTLFKNVGVWSNTKMLRLNFSLTSLENAKSSSKLLPFMTRNRSSTLAGSNTVPSFPCFSLNALNWDEGCGSCVDRLVTRLWWELYSHL